MSGYPCPVCEVMFAEPCGDVLDNATTAVLVADWRPSPLSAALESGSAVVSVPYLVAQPGWPMALADARAHEIEGCYDSGECVDCWRSVSVLQVEHYFWETNESALA